MNAVMPFDFEGRAIRVVEDGGGVPWFVTLDVCDALGIKNSSDAVNRLDDDEKGVVTTDTLGGQQQVSAVNEPGLYRLTLTSRKPEAKRFVRWITHDVLPAIRKTGRYAAPDANPEPPPVPQAPQHRADVLVSAARGFNALVRAGRTIGLSRIRAVRAGNDATFRATGIDLVAELDADDVLNETTPMALGDPTAERLNDWLQDRTRVTTREVVADVLGGQPDSRSQQMRAASLLRAAGWVAARVDAGSGSRHRIFVRALLA